MSQKSKKRTMADQKVVELEKENEYLKAENERLRKELRGLAEAYSHNRWIVDIVTSALNK